MGLQVYSPLYRHKAGFTGVMVYRYKARFTGVRQGLQVEGGFTVVASGD